jgi:hypothetical protein
MVGRRRLILLAVAVVLLVPRIGLAQGTCGQETVLIPDGRLTNGSLAASATGLYLVQTVVGRSYSVEIKPDPPNFSTPVTITIFNGTNTCGPATTLTQRDTAAIDPQIPANGRRRSFTAIDPANSGFHRIQVVNGTAAPITFTASASETTQFSPAWSTISSYDTFYSFYNTTNSTCNVTLTMVDTGGTLRTTFNGAVTTGTTLSTNTSALGTARGMAGTAKLTHDCPPGGILAEAAIANFSISPTPYFQFIHFQPTRESAH